MNETHSKLFDAVAFAARAHRNQIRKDGATPYASHCFRVCLVLRHVFSVTDDRILTAALLHDVIEDTTTDCDDLIEHFGAEIAGWVALLSKDKRLPDPQREPAFVRAFVSGGWPVHMIKLADVYDNISDCEHFPPEKRRTALARWKVYIDGLAPHITAESRAAFDLVQSLFDRKSAAVK